MRTSLVLPLAALAAGLIVGRTGFQLIHPASLRPVLTLVFVQVSIVLALLGLQLGRGLLRLSPGEVLRRSLPPFLFAAVTLAAGAWLLPRVLSGLERPFDAFHLPFAFILCALSLLAVRDLRTRPPEDVGPIFLVAIVLFGAVYSFAPTLVWSKGLQPGVLWRGPVLVLGESGALGIAAAVATLALTRRAGFPTRVVGTAVFAVALWLSFDWLLWPPFTALGFGIALGRAGEQRLPVVFAGSRAARSELPLLLLAGITFAPDLWRTSLVAPSLVWAAGVTVLALVARAALPRGGALVTGPGLLFLGLAVAVRLDPRMGPLGGFALDFALPAWLLGRLTFVLLQSRATTKSRSSEPSR